MATYSYQPLYDRYVQASYSSGFRHKMEFASFIEAVQRYQEDVLSIFNGSSDTANELQFRIEDLLCFVNTGDLRRALSWQLETVLVATCDPQGRFDQVQMSVEDILDGLRDGMDALDVLVNAFETTLNSEQSVVGRLTIFDGLANNAVPDPSPYVRSVIDRCRAAFSTAASDISALQLALWEIAGAGLFKRVSQQGDGMDLETYFSIAEKGYDAYSGIAPLAYLIRLIDVPTVSLVTAIATMGFVGPAVLVVVQTITAASFMAFMYGGMWYTKMVIRAWEAVGHFFRAENCVEASSSPDDFSINVGGNAYSFMRNDVVGRAIYDNYPALLQMLDERAETNMFVLPGFGFTAYVWASSPGLYKMVLRKHLMSNHYTRCLNRWFGDGNQYSSADIKNIIDVGIGTLPANPVFSDSMLDEGANSQQQGSNWDFARGMYEVENSIDYHLKAMLGDSEFAQYLLYSADDRVSFVTSPVVDWDTPTTQLTNLWMIQRATRALNQSQAVLIARVLAEAAKPDSPWVLVPVDAPLEGMWTIPTDKENFEYFKKEFMTVTAVVVAAAAAAAAVHFGLKFRGYAKGKSGQYFAQFLKAASDPSKTPQEVGKLLTKSNRWAKLAGAGSWVVGTATATTLDTIKFDDDMHGLSDDVQNTARDLGTLLSQLQALVAQVKQLIATDPDSNL